MRTLLGLFGLLGCGTRLLEDSATDDRAAEDSGTTHGTDTQTDTDIPKVDTGFALVYLAGSASVGADAWTGEEHQIGTSYDGDIEHCRITNPTRGIPVDTRCEGCTFAFDLTFLPGAAEGDACENLRFAADMVDGDTLTYGFAPTWTADGGGYPYTNLLLYGYDDGAGMRWIPWASATVELEPDGATSRIDYEALYAYTSYYYSL